MKRRWLAIALLGVIVSSAVLGSFLLQPSHHPLAAPEIGVFYYAWYGATASDWERPKFEDFPVMGNYTSSDPAAIEQQLFLMQNADIDFAIISWHGFYDAYGLFIDNATKQIFTTAQAMNSSLKFAVMVEPFNQTKNYDSAYDYRAIYNYVWDNFVQPFPLLYFKQSNKSLICFFNDPNNTPGLTPTGNFLEDIRFTRLIVGQQNYTQWTYTDLNDKDTPQHGPLNQTTVTPRYDEQNLPDRPGNVTADIYLDQGTYSKEWANAINLWLEGKVKTILISSWNEYPERTAIEPHYDGTSTFKDPYYLYDMTKSYIDDLNRQATKETD